LVRYRRIPPVLDGGNVWLTGYYNVWLGLCDGWMGMQVEGRDQEVVSR